MYHANNKFRPEYVGMLIDYFAEGKSLSRYLADVDVTKTTFYAWMDRYKEYKEAYVIAQIKSEAYWLDQVEHNMCNPDFNFNAAKFVLSHRFGITAKRKQKAAKWLDTSNLIESFNSLLQAYKDDDVDIGELKDVVSVLLDVANLKERTELEERISQLEEGLKSGNESTKR